jgi:hypothetical protein
MAFEVERIDTPELRAELKSLKLKSPLSAIDPMDLRDWCVDRRAGLYFVIYGGGALEIPHLMALADRDGVVVEIEADRSAVGNVAPHSIEVAWTITDFRVAPRATSQSQQLETALRDALVAYGAHGRPDITKSVRVAFDLNRK